MKPLAICLFLTLLAGFLAGCGGEPASGPQEDRMLFNQSPNPVGDAEESPFRPSSPALLDIPVGPKTQPHQ